MTEQNEQTCRLQSKFAMSIVQAKIIVNDFHKRREDDRSTCSVKLSRR